MRTKLTFLFGDRCLLAKLFVICLHRHEHSEDPVKYLYLSYCTPYDSATVDFSHQQQISVIVMSGRSWLWLTSERTEKCFISRKNGKHDIDFGLNSLSFSLLLIPLLFLSYFLLLKGKKRFCCSSNNVSTHTINYACT